METTITEEKNDTGIIKAFIDLMDNIFYEGYAKTLALENPERYDFELEQFLDNYCF